MIMSKNHPTAKIQRALEQIEKKLKHDAQQREKAKEELREEALFCTVEGKKEIQAEEQKARADLFSLFNSKRDAALEKKAFDFVEEAEATTESKTSSCVIA